MKLWKIQEANSDHPKHVYVEAKNPIHAVTTLMQISHSGLAVLWQNEKGTETIVSVQNGFSFSVTETSPEKELDK